MTMFDSTEILRRSFDAAVEDVEKLIAERDEARAEATRLRAALTAGDEEIGVGDWVAVFLGHALVENVGDRNDDGIPIISIGHEAIGLVEAVPIVLTGDVMVVRVAAPTAAPGAKGGAK